MLYAAECDRQRITTYDDQCYTLGGIRPQVVCNAPFGEVISHGITYSQVLEAFDCKVGRVFDSRGSHASSREILGGLEGLLGKKDARR
jgi:hypothetical protein